MASPSDEPTTRYRVAVDAAVRGDGVDGLSVTVGQPDGLARNETSSHSVTFESTRERRLEELPFYAAERPEEGPGDGWLGVAAACGFAWTAEGERIQDDPCAGAGVAVGVGPDEPLTVPMRLYPRTESGQVEEGTYTFVAPLDEQGADLVLTYEVSAQQQQPD